MLDARELESERRLVEASQRQPRRFAKLYERYFDRVYAFAFTRTGDRTAAEDVAAETFRVALENLPGFPDYHAPLPNRLQGNLGTAFDELTAGP